MKHSAARTPAIDDDRDALLERIRRLEVTNAALMDRVERSSDMHGGAFSMFETAITLEQMVRERTAELEAALADLNTAHADLAAAHRDADAARARLRDAIESLPDGFALFDAADRLVMYNRSYMHFWPALASRDLTDITFAEVAETVARAGSAVGSLVSPERWLADRLAHHAQANRVHVQALSDGRWIQINELPTTEGGRVSIYTDVTEIKTEDARERARELAEHNVALQTTLDALSAGVCLYDGNRRLKVRNEAIVRLLGLDARGAKVLETHDGLLAHCAGALGIDRPAVLDWRASPGQRQETHCRLGARHFVIRTTPLMPAGMAFSFDDITDRVNDRNALAEAAEMLERRVAARTAELESEIAERRQVEAALLAAKTAAEHANRSKTSFIAAASHDLLQPLNAARLFVSALGERRLAPPTRALVRQTAVALDSVEDLLEALFEISRLDAGAIKPELGPIELEQMLAALRIEFAPVARSAGLALDIPESTLWVESDFRLLRRILQNFLSNAIRYTGQGHVSIRAARQGDQVVITVADTGPGIAPENQTTIFEEFRRLENAQRIPGKGLGLAIVHRASTMLGHPLTLVSEAGAGAAFSIAVPAALPSARRSDTPMRHFAAPGSATGKVIVIDSDAAILEGMGALIRGWGYQVVAGSSAADPALREAAASCDLIIADFHLDGEELGDSAVAAIRACAGAPVPALIITADRSEPVKARLAAAELPLLNKPVKPAQLRALMRTLMAARS